MVVKFAFTAIIIIKMGKRIVFKLLRTDPESKINEKISQKFINQAIAATFVYLCWDVIVTYAFPFCHLLYEHVYLSNSWSN